MDWNDPDIIRSPIAHWPKWVQALVSAALFYLWIYEAFLKPPPPPDAPKQAFIFTLIMIAAVFIASELLRPKPKIEGERPKNLGDFRVTTATQGRPVPLIFGTVLQEGPNVIWWGDFRQVAIRKKIKTGMFSSKTITTGFKYFLGFQFGVCRGEDVDLLRIIVGDKEAFSGLLSGESSTFINKPNHFGGDEFGAGGLRGTFRWYPGTAGQSSSTYLSTFQSVGGTTLNYKKTAYGVFERGEHGTQTNIESWKFEVRRISNGLGLGGGTHIVNGFDMNPMNVLYELLTDNEWGFNLPLSKVDTAVMTSVAGVLFSEGNGISMILDSNLTALEFLDEIERQIDGLIFQDPETGKYTVKLARFDYTIGALPLLDEDNLIEVADYSQGTWEQTSNQVRISFANRLNDYADDYGVYFDGANAQIQGGGTVTTAKNIPISMNFPGVKDAGLAAKIASREGRSLSIPLGKATFKVTRDLYNLKPGSVFKWTDAARGITELPMRVQRIDYGTLVDGPLLIDAIQDVFSSADASFGSPPITGWTPPADALIAFPVAEQLAIEAPRALRYRDPELSGVPTNSKLWCAARNQRGEVEFLITERNASGAPAGVFNTNGEVQAFVKIGQLQSNLDSGTNGTASFIVTATPDTQGDIEDAFVDNPDVVEKGTDLLNCILIGSEFMLAGAATISGPDVSLTGVHRGVMDSAQEPHLAGDDVYVVFSGAGLSEGNITPTHNVDVRLIPRSISDELPSASANTIALTMANRLRRPYCPSRVSLNNVIFDATSVSLDFLAGGAPETTGIDLDLIRRDYRIGEGADEIPPLTIDAATLFTDFPAANSTTTELTVIDDPLGSPTTLFTVTAIGGTQQDLLRIEVLANTDGAVPSTLRIELRARHDDGALLALLSTNALIFDFTTVSAALAGQFNFGARAQAVTSNLYTATVAGTYNFTLSTALPVGEDVEYRLNGGSWTQLIAGGLTVGIIVGVLVSDTIEVRHQGAAGTLRKQLDMVAAGAGQDGYFIVRD